MEVGHDDSGRYAQAVRLRKKLLDPLQVALYGTWTDEEGEEWINQEVKSGLETKLQEINRERGLLG